MELGIIEQLKSHLPDEGTIETGGKYNARYKWETNAGGFNQGVYTFDGNKNATTPNIAIPRKAPSPLHILLSMTSGNFPRPINTLTEEVCHAFQHRDGLSLVTPLLLEAQAKRLHNESPPRLRDHETLSENSSGRIVDYNYTQVTGDYLVQHFRSYGYKRAYVSWEHVVEDLRDYLTKNNLPDFMRTIPIAARAMTVGTRQENIDDKKARYVNEAYDKLRAMNISESSLASLASFPGKWQNGTFSRKEETITRWMKHYDYTEADINALIEAELLRNRVGQLLMRKYAQEEFEKIFETQPKFYPLTLAPDTKLEFDHK